MGRVLVIQGEPALLDALHGDLAPRGHAIESCGGNVEAIHYVRRHAVDLVITDPATSVSEDLALARSFARPDRDPHHRSHADGRARRGDRRAARARLRVLQRINPDRRDRRHGGVGAQGRSGNDDIEVISGLPHWLTLRVSCGLLTAERLTRFLSEFETTLPRPTRDLLITAFRENAAQRDGAWRRLRRRRVVEVTAARTCARDRLPLQDPGGGFDEATAAPVAASHSPDDLIAAMLKREELGMRPGGLGLLIVRQIVDELVTTSAATRPSSSSTSPDVRRRTSPPTASSGAQLALGHRFAAGYSSYPAQLFRPASIREMDMKRSMSLAAVMIVTMAAMAAAQTDTSRHAAMAPAKSEAAVTLKQDMRKLWTDHVVWTRDYIVAAVGDQPDADAAANRLMKNQEDLGTAVAKFYGDSAGRQLTTLLKEHISIAVDLIKAAKAGDQGNQQQADKRGRTTPTRSPTS
jgi:hypothetical protein